MSKMDDILAKPTLGEQIIEAKRSNMTKESALELVADPRYTDWLRANKDAIIEWSENEAKRKQVHIDRACKLTDAELDALIEHERAHQAAAPAVFNSELLDVCVEHRELRRQHSVTVGDR